MSIYQMADGSIVNTEKAVKSWSINANRSQWPLERLYLSSKGRYYIEHISRYEDLRNDIADFVNRIDAIKWMMLNGVEIPADMREDAKNIEE